MMNTQSLRETDREREREKERPQDRIRTASRGCSTNSRAPIPHEERKAHMLAYVHTHVCQRRRPMNGDVVRDNVD